MTILAALHTLPSKYLAYKGPYSSGRLWWLTLVVLCRPISAKRSLFLEVTGFDGKEPQHHPI